MYFFELDFPIKKHNFLISFLFFVSALHLEGLFFFQCVVSNFYHGDHNLTVHVRRGTGISHLFYMTLVSLKFRLMSKLENLPIFGLCLYLWLI